MVFLKMRVFYPEKEGEPIAVIGPTPIAPETYMETTVYTVHIQCAKMEGRRNYREDAVKTVRELDGIKSKFLQH
jgi:hypothetical protein